MPPIDLEHWSREDMLAHAYERGRYLRLRRRAVRGLMAGLSAVVIGLGFGAIRMGAAQDAEVHTVGPGPVTEATDVTSTTTMPRPTATTIVGARSEVVAAAPQRSSAPSAQAVATTTTTELFARQDPDCGTLDVQADVVTDKDSYSPFELVHVTARAKNVTRHDCSMISQVEFWFTDAKNRAIGLGQTISLDYPQGTRWSGGETKTFTAEWDQHCAQQDRCTAGFAPRGQYTAHVRVDGASSWLATVNFALD